MKVIGEVFAGETHDHHCCIERALASAERLCGERGLRLTAQRLRVLEVVADRHVAIGAYEIMEIMAVDGRRPAPISVYRALDFLVANGLIHRLASLNAYIVCALPGASHRAQFLICRHCGTVAELKNENVDRALDGGAEAAGFTIATAIVEISGLCRQCRNV